MPTIQQLKQAIVIAEKIEALQAQLNAIVGSSSEAPRKPGRPAKVPTTSFIEEASQAVAKEKKVKAPKKAKRVLSPEALEKIREGQRKRWAAVAKAKKAK